MMQQNVAIDKMQQNIFLSSSLYFDGGGVNWDQICFPQNLLCYPLIYRIYLSFVSIFEPVPETQTQWLIDVVG